MTDTNVETLEALGYKIENCKIACADLRMGDRGCITMYMELDGDGWGCVYGGYCLGHGYVGAEEFEGAPAGIEFIMRVMDVADVSDFSQLKGQYIRVATRGVGSTVKIIGNIIKDKWFNPEVFFAKSGAKETLFEDK